MILAKVTGASLARLGILSVLIITAMDLGWAAQEPLRRFRQTHRAMGTEFTIDLYAKDEQTAAQIADSAFEEVDRMEALLSNYRPSSELSRISREAGAGPVTTDPETFQFLDRAFFWSRQSSGAFDITVGPLLRVWGFFFHDGRIPSEAELNGIRKKIGWYKVLLDPAKRTVAFTNGQAMELDPGSIGKGFAIDRVVALLRSEGVLSAFLSAGGSTLYGIGTPPGEAGWPVNVPDPYHPGEIASKILLKDESLSTGACTEKYFIKDGHRYCHIFDPHTMRPIEGMLQTTVIDPSATDSDALSTVAFVLSPEASSKFFASMKETRVLIFASPASGRTATPRCAAIHWAGDPCNRAPK
jgi:thiamine biosynthesis lipoprotein